MIRNLCLLFTSALCLQLAIAEKEPKNLAVLNILRFKNNECTTTSGVAGVCYKADECRDASGTASGSCAAGFGVCCLFQVTTCGATVTRNNTYVANPNFPASYAPTAAPETCTYTVTTTDTNICRIKLDFLALSLAQPVVMMGVCTTDTITFTSPVGFSDINALCGTMTGQHLYLDAPETGTLAAFAMRLGDTITARNWRIRVLTIPCDSGLLPPSGCSQYITGITGNVQNYNFGSLIRNNGYNTCIRKESGFCRIQYTSSSSAAPEPFKIDIVAKTARQSKNCMNAVLLIPNTLTDTNNAEELICGDVFNVPNLSSAPGPVVGDAPFELRLITTDVNLDRQTGYNLDYRQLPCRNI